ncbi:alpha/beta fold hydrolase [Hyphococcus sp.]|jgi:pimeloyl-ACP methyl ester carboxylesterase|uniref:alpha/beta fold hydrolase n=1 Tax=Hyphococcus sp. TaxID=2038636 RepID=UPI003D1174D4
MKKRYLVPLIPIALLAGAFLALRTPATDPAVMEAKYANAASRFVEGPNGLRVHYRDEGNKDGVPIVLLHGNSATLHTWEPLVQRLGGEYRMITLTLPGHGLTGPNANRDYSYKGMAEAVDLVVDATDLDRFVIGGNSMGGWISWRYALANPDKVDALILLDASGMPLREGETPPPLNLGFRLLQNPLGRFLLKYVTPRGAMETSLRQSVSVESFIDEATIDRYWELYRLPGNREAAGDRAIADREPGYADRIGEIKTPALILWGKDDPLIHASAAVTFKERLPQAEVVIYEGVGHIPMEEAPDRTAADMDAFLDRVLTPVSETN